MTDVCCPPASFYDSTPEYVHPAECPRRGVFSGELSQPATIGSGKALAIRSFLGQQRGAPEHCLFAYGDHYSDLAMLQLARHPVVVAGDADLERYAREHHWPILLEESVP